MEKLLQKYIQIIIIGRNLKIKKDSCLYLCGLFAPITNIISQSVFDSLKNLHAQCRHKLQMNIDR
jgi:hypothetical protein